MAQCKLCGKKSFFLKVDAKGLCSKCAIEYAKCEKYKKEHIVDILFDVYNRLVQSETYTETVYTLDGTCTKRLIKRNKNNNVLFWENWVNPLKYENDKDNFVYYLIKSPDVPNNCRYYLLGSFYENYNNGEDFEEQRAQSIYYYSKYLNEQPLPQAVSQAIMCLGMEHFSQTQYHLFMINFKIAKMFETDKNYELALKYMLAAFDTCVHYQAMRNLYDSYRKVNNLPEFLEKLDYYYDKANLNKDPDQDDRDHPSGWNYEILKLEAEIKIKKNYVFKPRSK